MAGFGRIDLKLKAEGLREKRRRFYDLNLAESLRQNLSGKSLVEHPIIIVSLQSHRDFFDNMSDDEEEESQVPSEKVEEDKTDENSEVYKNCYDYYLNYYKDKYGVQSEQTESNEQAEPPPLSTGLVAYSGSDTE